MEGLLNKGDRQNERLVSMKSSTPRRGLGLVAAGIVAALAASNTPVRRFCERLMLHVQTHYGEKAGRHAWNRNPGRMGITTPNMIRFGVAASLCCLALTLGVPARAASVQRVGDGRVIVTMLGEKMAFREADASLVSFGWVSSGQLKEIHRNGSCYSMIKSEATLTLWLNDKQAADCLNRSYPDDAPLNGGAVGFLIHFRLDQGRVFPGGVDANDFPRDLPGVRSNIFLKYLTLDLMCLTPASQSATASGFIPLQKERYSQSYILPPERRLNGATRRACFLCDLDNPNTRRCGVRLVSSDKTVAIGFVWSEAAFQEPPSQWVLYDAAARRIAQSIFIDRPVGDFQ